MIRSLLTRISRHLPLRVIAAEEGDYLHRFYVCGPAPHNFPPGVRVVLGRLPVTVFLHRFVRSDRDRELHNHPWDRAWSLVLAGGYVEERRHGDEVRTHVVRPWSWNKLLANTFHRVDLIENDCWTIFVTGDRVQDWGFWDRDTGGYTPWREYLRQRGLL